jgi:hypothetical protein
MIKKIRYFGAGNQKEMAGKMGEKARRERGK